MNVLISGSTGLLGSVLVPALKQVGHGVTKLFRARDSGLAAQGHLWWDPSKSVLEITPEREFDAVIHLSGESIAGGRWTKRKKNEIRNSRLQGTRLLVEKLSLLINKPKVFISASAIGYYGNRGEEWLTESSAPASDFLGQLCQEWEEGSRPLESHGVRVVHLRFGIILSPNGGALGQMLPIFRLGLGGKLGGGRQYMSWVCLDDVIGVIQSALTHDGFKGAVNVVSPNPVTNQEFTKTLGRVLKRPTLIPAPALGLKLLLGEMAEALLLSSARVKPEKLLAEKYEFKHTDLEECLKTVIPECLYRESTIN